MKKIVYVPDNDLYPVCIGEIYQNLFYGYGQGLTEDKKAIKFTYIVSSDLGGSIYTDLVLELSYQNELNVLKVYVEYERKDILNSTEKLFEALARKFGGAIFIDGVQIGEDYKRKACFNRDTPLEYKELTYKLLKGEAL